MADIVDKATRSRMMAGIRCKDTEPEMVLRRALHARGFRYRLHGKDIPGRPDLILAKYRAVVFVHGCFWHRHGGCRFATTPTSRSTFWTAKFEANRKRDKDVQCLLASKGWRVATIWGCALRNPAHVSATCERLTEWLVSGAAAITIGETDLVASASANGSARGGPSWA